MTFREPMSMRNRSNALYNMFLTSQAAALPVPSRSVIMKA
jgi:hypothetical protein